MGKTVYKREYVIKEEFTAVHDEPSEETPKKVNNTALHIAIWCSIKQIWESLFSN